MFFRNNQGAEKMKKLEKEVMGMFEKLTPMNQSVVAAEGRGVGG
jgi:hypothetical protein